MVLSSLPFANMRPYTIQSNFGCCHCSRFLLLLYLAIFMSMKTVLYGMNDRRDGSGKADLLFKVKRRPVLKECFNIQFDSIDSMGVDVSNKLGLQCIK